MSRVTALRDPLIRPLGRGQRPERAGSPAQLLSARPTRAAPYIHRDDQIQALLARHTAAFAVHTIGTWWAQVDSVLHSGATRLLICADGGGSNGYRTRAWKTELADLAASTGLTITVCHLPPGTSKWNTVEHQLFSYISTNWRGRPLTSHEVIVQTIAATTTSTGLSVHAELDHSSYPT